MAWKPIAGYEGLYEVSDAGEVRRLRGFWCQKTRPVSAQKGRYARVSLWRDGSRRSYRPLVHRLVYETFVGHIPAELTVNHKNGNRRDNRACNLELATMREQMLHAYATCLQPRAKGEARKNVAKLTDDAVRDIRARYKWRKVTARMLAAEYGVSKGCILSVVNRTRWAHV